MDISLAYKGQILIAGIITFIGFLYLHRMTRTLKFIAVTGEKTHLLVNSNMGIQLKLNKVSTQRIADITHDPVDINAALWAKQLFDEHQRKQETVDNKEFDEKINRTKIV